MTPPTGTAPAVRAPMLRAYALVLGLLLLGYTLSGLVRERGFMIDTVSADGVIVAVRTLAGNTAAPVIRFTDEHGAVVDWVPRTPMSDAVVGGHVPVLYRPDTPGAIVIGSFWGIYRIFLATGLAGLLLLAYGSPVAIGMANGRMPWR